MQYASLVIACHESEAKIRDTLRAAINAGFMRNNVSSNPFLSFLIQFSFYLNSNEDIHSS